MKWAKNIDKLKRVQSKFKDADEATLLVEYRKIGGLVVESEVPVIPETIIATPEPLPVIEISSTEIIEPKKKSKKNVE